MKLFKTKLLPTLTAGILAISLSGVNAATDDDYDTNDLLLFFQNPTGTVGTDKVVTFSLGNVVNVFRNAATPGDATFGDTISLGNINTILTSTYDTDWSSLLASSSIFAGAAGQNHSTSNLVNTTSPNGDYARTVYVTRSRSGQGAVGSANSSNFTLPSGAAGQSDLAAGISSSNTGASAGQPIALNTTGVGGTTIDDENPFFNGNPATAYGQLSGGVMGRLSSTTYTFGNITGVVLALDLYRATPVENASGWQNINGLQDQIGAREGYYLGTVTLSSNGDVNFTAVPEPSTIGLIALGSAALLFRSRRRKVNA